MNYLKLKQIVVFITFCFLLSCNQGKGPLSKVAGKQIKIDTSINAVDSIETFVAPFKNRINQVLDSTLAYAPKPLLLDDGNRNTSMGNLMADIVFKETHPIFKSKMEKELDFVVLNRGGIRSIISKGDVTARNAYQVMPFENYISVVELSGTAVRKLISFLSTSERAHPVSGIQIILDKKGGLESVSIQGSPFDENRNYYIATSDYLVQGGPSIGFFDEIISTTDTGYLLRNAIIDHFKKTDSVKAEVDDRFIQLD
ncbi:5'-nucleotidase C-terminal domain-containing protein [Flagellimonas sp. CMM7]|uniref:5'-nucleotidase C-terminal domain-containing protein n=1 Tax=Flagellimonas sp. CMM7 TaxID=2654676 RepID=UPI001F43F2E2|nr:5'-nucleotidase [Flagellimonas sp. CMM7]UII79251.1 5'-nucleotidase C-terminal domain-containing protein [Flagellimonas sp. CMM7]